MSSKERQVLLRLLPGLPAEAGMSGDDRQHFMDAFMSHPEHPSWRPVFVSDEEVAANAFDILRIQEEYLLALRKEIEAGNIPAFDQHHLPETRVGKNIFISRAAAQGFLTQRHLRFTENLGPESPASAPRCASGSEGLRSAVTRRLQKDNPTNDLVGGPALDGRAPPLSPIGTQIRHQAGLSGSLKRANKAAIKKPAAESIDQDPHPGAPLVILRRKQVEERTSLSRSAIYDRLDPHSPRYDPSFPKQIKLSANSAGWVEAEIDHWLHMRLRDRA